MSTFNRFDPDSSANEDSSPPYDSINCAAYIDGRCQSGSTFATTVVVQYGAASQTSSSDLDEPSTSVTDPNTTSTPLPFPTTSSIPAIPTTSLSSAFHSAPTSTPSSLLVNNFGELSSSSKPETTSTSSIITSLSNNVAQTGSTLQTHLNATVTESRSSSTASDTLKTPSPLPEVSPPSSVVTQGGPASISPAPAAIASSSNKHSHHIGAIVGGVVGGLGFLLLAIVTTILYLRMRARRTAPSAEFIDVVRRKTPGPVPASGAMRAEGTTTPSGDRLLGLQDEDEERPPAFILGAYRDPVLEKVQEAAAMREQYQWQDSYAETQVAYAKEGKSEVGHEDESTEVGTEEDYEDEKAGYTWAM